jgi:hypothetical protein
MAVTLFECDLFHRYAGTVVTYNKWDQSMMELVNENDEYRKAELQNWYSTKKERLEGIIFVLHDMLN